MDVKNQIKMRSQHLSLCHVELVKPLPIHRYSVDKLSYSGPSGIFGSGELLHLPLVLMNRLNKIESVVFLYCRFSLFVNDPISRHVRIQKVFSEGVKLFFTFFS